MQYIYGVYCCILEDPFRFKVIEITIKKNSSSLSSIGEESGVVRLHQELSDALTDLLLIFYPEYAAKEDA